MKIITAREAFNNGLTRYFTGKECMYGHLSERMISNGSCVDCLKERRARTRQDIYEATKVWRLKNPEARTKEAALYRKKHPDKVAVNAKAYRERNIEEVRKRERENARRMRSLNPEREKERLRRHSEKLAKRRVEEAGREKPDICDICGLNEFKIVFDHCHTKGHFRGWICDRCNRVLGIVKDDCELLSKMKDYLEKDFEQNNHQGEKQTSC
jgi:hypothetical protein